MTKHITMEDSDVQVEVSVQDCWDETSDWASNLDRSSGENSLISAETWQNWFERWLAILFADLPPAPKYELSLRLTDDDEIQALNTRYRHQDKPTDVLAFAALEVDFPQIEEIQQRSPLYLGDIVISVDTARRQASQQGHTLAIELPWLAAHGLLHLLGWDHPDEDSLVQMLDRQTIMLQTVGIAVNTAEISDEGYFKNSSSNE